MGMYENLDVRMKINAAGLTFKDVAGKIGISSVHMSRLLSKPLNSKNWVRIMKAIEDLKK